jgi:uncharacterized protein
MASLASYYPADGAALAVLYLSVTDFCNLECDYCSADAGPHKRRHLAQETALKAINDWLQALRAPAARLVFTGGEASFWGYDRLSAVCERARQRALDLGIRLEIGIQSNGTTATLEFIDFCRRWQVEPSFSLDGTPSMSNVHRGKGEIVFRNLRRLQEMQVPFALIICLTREVADDLDAVLDFLEQNRLFKVRLNILGVPPGQRTRTSIDAADILHVKKILYARAQRGGSGDDVLREYNVQRQTRWFDQTVQGRAVTKGHCEQESCQAGVKTAVVNPDGRWGMCVEKSMTDGLPLFEDKQALAIGAQQFWQARQGWDACTTCAARSICDHGCIAYHKGDHAIFEEECQANQQFWNFLVHARLLHQEPTVAAGKRPLTGRLIQPLLSLH